MNTNLLRWSCWCLDMWIAMYLNQSLILNLILILYLQITPSFQLGIDRILWLSYKGFQSHMNWLQKYCHLSTQLTDLRFCTFFLWYTGSIQTLELWEECYQCDTLIGRLWVEFILPQFNVNNRGKMIQKRFQLFYGFNSCIHEIDEPEIGKGKINRFWSKMISFQIKVFEIRQRRERGKNRPFWNRSIGEIERLKRRRWRKNTWNWAHFIECKREICEIWKIWKKRKNWVEMKICIREWENLGYRESNRLTSTGEEWEGRWLSGWRELWFNYKIRKWGSESRIVMNTVQSTIWFQLRFRFSRFRSNESQIPKSEINILLRSAVRVHSCFCNSAMVSNPTNWKRPTCSDEW